MKRLKLLFLMVLISALLEAMSINEAQDVLRGDRYGFLFVDAGITDDDLAHFDALNIEKASAYHHFGDLERVGDEVADFFIQIGPNQPDIASSLAIRISEIAHEIVRSSGKEAAWVFLRAFLPTDQYNLPRWHFDGAYYKPEWADDSLYKFVVTLVGPSTLFYELPPELRKMGERHVRDRYFMKNFCLPEKVAIPRRGEGAIFNPLYGFRAAALHSEPPIHEKRLFFSIVPCMERDLADLKKRVLSIYPKGAVE